MYCTELAFLNSWCLFHGIIKSFGLEVTFKGHIAQPPCNDQGELQQIRLLRALPSLTLNVSRAGASSTSLSSLWSPWCPSSTLAPAMSFLCWAPRDGPLQLVQVPLNSILSFGCVSAPSAWCHLQTCWVCNRAHCPCHWWRHQKWLGPVTDLWGTPLLSHQEVLTHLLGLTPRQRGSLPSSTNTDLL